LWYSNVFQCPIVNTRIIQCARIIELTFIVIDSDFQLVDSVFKFSCFQFSCFQPFFNLSGGTGV
jgi:hypothetical protein